MIGLFFVALGILLIIFRRKLAGEIMSSRELYFKVNYSDEQKKWVAIVPLIGGVFFVITGILQFLGLIKIGK